MLEKIKKAVYAFKGLYWNREKPVLVYAPGRVGSMGLIKNLRQADVFSFKVESFDTERRGATRFVREYIINRQRPARVVSLVRDPVAIMSSYYFSKSLKGHISESRSAMQEKNVPHLVQIFIDKVLKTERLDRHLYWFENEFAKHLGFSVFDYPFDTDKKYATIDHPIYPALILRSDLLDARKSDILQSFLGNPHVTVTRENTRSAKSDAELYEAFKTQVRIPSEIINKIYSSPYAVHFFSPEERDDLIKKWSA